MNEQTAYGIGRFVEPAVVTSNFHLREGDTVADLGAGTGYFIAALSERVGSEGKVYALEVQKNLIEAISNLARKQHLSNVTPLWGDIEEAGATDINDGEADAAILVNTLFQVEDKDGALEEAARILRPGGKLFVIDWSESYGGLGPAPEAVVTETAARDLCESHGLVYERNFAAGEHHYGLAFRKP